MHPIQHEIYWNSAVTIKSKEQKCSLPIFVAAPTVQFEENAAHPEFGNHKMILAQANCLTGCISAIQT